MLFATLCYKREKQDTDFQHNISSSLSVGRSSEQMWIFLSV